MALIDLLHHSVGAARWADCLLSLERWLWLDVSRVLWLESGEVGSCEGGPGVHVSSCECVGVCGYCMRQVLSTCMF